MSDFIFKLDGTPALNLASFVTTFMEDEAEQLMKESLSKNFIDFEEYPQTAEICVSTYILRCRCIRHADFRFYRIAV